MPVSWSRESSRLSDLELDDSEEYESDEEELVKIIDPYQFEPYEDDEEAVAEEEIPQDINRLQNVECVK